MPIQPQIALIDAFFSARGTVDGRRGSDAAVFRAILCVIDQAKSSIIAAAQARQRGDDGAFEMAGADSYKACMAAAAELKLDVLLRALNDDDRFRFNDALLRQLRDDARTALANKVCGRIVVFVMLLFAVEFVDRPISCSCLEYKIQSRTTAAVSAEFPGKQHLSSVI